MRCDGCGEMLGQFCLSLKSKACLESVTPEVEIGIELTAKIDHGNARKKYYCFPSKEPVCYARRLP